MRVAVHGSGIAACCSAYLLGSAGHRVGLRSTERPRVPAILVGQATQQLICDVFGKSDLFSGAFRIERRVVSWGRSAQPQAFPHFAAVISEAALAGVLEPIASPEDAQAEWTVYAATHPPSGSVEYRLGARIATATPVGLNDSRDSDACWIESVENGWLFLIPNAPGSGWILAVGAAIEQLLDESSLIAPRVTLAIASSRQFPAYPRIVQPLCGHGWLACGSAALGFDPLCGDGTGHAIREAILASAVLRAVAKGEPAANLLDHYQARLTAAFARHLELSKQFYESANRGPWWQSELDALRVFPKAPPTPFRYRLRGFELEAINAAHNPS